MKHEVNIRRLCMRCMAERPLNEEKCSACSFDEVAYVNTHIDCLPLRVVLENQYVIGEEINRGGFGITYRAYDIVLQKTVCIKELFPSIVVRDKTGALVPQCGHESEFDALKEKALNEARHLSSFDNLPGIVKVLYFFEANNTAYMVMNYIDGENLESVLQRKGKLSTQFVLEMMEPIIKSLAKIHDKGIIHRDISPSNLMLTADNNVVLIDFGSAREYAAQLSKSLTATYKGGYTPIEQYDPKGEQGPWTDVYALSATILKLTTGKDLPLSISRRKELKLSDIDNDLTNMQKTALIKGLSINGKDRYSNIDEFYKDLYETSNSSYYIRKLRNKYLCALLLIALCVCPVYLHYRNRPLTMKMPDVATENKRMLTIEELRWQKKHYMMCSYMEPRLKTEYAKQQYKSFHDNYNKRTGGHDFSKDDDDVQSSAEIYKMRPKIYKEAEKLLQEWNAK